jgi:hypothetical protein
MALRFLDLHILHFWLVKLAKNSLANANATFPKLGLRKSPSKTKSKKEKGFLSQKSQVHRQRKSGHTFLREIG